MNEAPRLKPMTVMEIIDASFRLYRQNFVTFLGIFAVALVPVMALDIYMSAVVEREQQAYLSALQTRAASPEVPVGCVVAFVAYFLILLIHHNVLTPIATGALTSAVGDRYLNRPASLGRSYGVLFRNFFRYFLTVFLSGLVISIGFMFCLVPGFFFLVWFFMTSSVCVLEGLGGGTAMGRSRELARGHGWRILGFWLLSTLVNLAFIVPIIIFSSFVVPHFVDNAFRQTILQGVLSNVIVLLISPLWSVGWVLLYYDIRIRKEGFDIEVLQKSMAGPGTFFQPGQANP